MASVTTGGNYTKIAECRVCQSQQLTPVVKFDPQFIASTFVETNEDNPISKIKIPLTLLLCQGCGLAQLEETVLPDLLYKSYFYRSGVTETMKRDLGDVVANVLTEIKTFPGDLVLDIGCNDGLMLSLFPPELKRVGIDAAENIDWAHLDDSIEIINDYFPSGRLTGRKFKAITSTAMFYDFDDPNQATRNMAELLDEDGVICIQVSYLYDTIRDMNFYDICHEHLEYYSLKTLSHLMDRNGLEVFDASVNAVNGGTLRVLIAHKAAKRERSNNFESLLLREKVLRLESEDTYDTFSRLIELNASRVKGYVQDQVEQGKLIIGLGASTKGNVLLQVCGIGKDLLPYISERSPLKVGLRTMGSDIELISEQAARDLNPEVMFVIPWNFKTEIVARERGYLDSGGRLLFIMPYPHFIDKTGETRL